jgi:hypothetical protein
MNSNPDSTFTVKTLAEFGGSGQLGITSIDLTGDTTDIRLPDWSVITGQSTFTMGGVERAAADVTLMAEAQGYDVRTSAVLTTTTRTTTQTAIDSDGDIAFRIVSVALVDGSQTTNSYDDNGDGQFDRTQRITIAVDGNTRTETTVNKLMAEAQGFEVLESVSVPGGNRVKNRNDDDSDGQFDWTQWITNTGNGSGHCIIARAA